MYSLKSFDQNWTYNNIDCYFVVCQTCFWTATILDLAEKRYNHRNPDGIISTCPMGSSGTILADLRCKYQTLTSNKDNL
jgi:hypothetical protein